MSIRGRSCGVANIVLLSHCGEYLANVKHLYSRLIRQKWYDCPGELLEKVRPFKWLRMLPNFLRIPANFLRSLRSVCRISGESFAYVKTTCEWLTTMARLWLLTCFLWCTARLNSRAVTVFYCISMTYAMCLLAWHLFYSLPIQVVLLKVLICQTCVFSYQLK